MTSFTLKIIAIITMFLDHFSYAYFGKFTILNCIGRISFPIFAFQISEGYLHTKNIKKYFIRLTSFALLSQIPFMLFYSTFSEDIYRLNVFFTLLLGLLSIFVYDKLKDKSLIHHIVGILFIVVASLVANYTKMDYGYFGIILIFVFYLFKNNKLLMNAAFLILIFVKYFSEISTFVYYLIFSPAIFLNYIYYFLVIVFYIIALLIINLYNNQQGLKVKYILYFFYPVHLILLYFMHIILQ